MGTPVVAASSPGHAVFGLVFGWPVAPTVRQFRPRTHSTFFFYMASLTNDGGPGCYFRFSKISPPMGPHWLGIGHFGATWVG